MLAKYHHANTQLASFLVVPRVVMLQLHLARMFNKFSCCCHCLHQIVIPQVQVSAASNNLGLVPGSASAAASMEPAAEAASASAKYSYPLKSQMMQKALDKHNTYRARHGAGPLNWYNTLAASAGAAAARRCISQSKSYYGTSKAGESVYYTSMRGDPVRLLTKAIDSWYQESSMYDFDKPGVSAKTHRFTQASHRLSIYNLAVHASALHCHIIALSRQASFIVATCVDKWYHETGLVVCCNW
jgi:hypothetical protein